MLHGLFDRCHGANSGTEASGRLRANAAAARSQTDCKSTGAWLQVQHGVVALDPLTGHALWNVTHAAWHHMPILGIEEASEPLLDASLGARSAPSCSVNLLPCGKLAAMLHACVRVVIGATPATAPHLDLTVHAALSLLAPDIVIACSSAMHHGAAAPQARLS